MLIQKRRVFGQFGLLNDADDEVVLDEALQVDLGCEAFDHFGIGSFGDRFQFGQFDSAAQRLILIEHVLQFLCAIQHKNDRSVLIL